MFFKSDTTTNIGFLTEFLPTSVLSMFHNFSVTWCMDDWENQHEFYLWMLSTLNFKPYVGILSSYHITSMYISGLPYAIYGQHMFILSIMGLHGTNPRELPEKSCPIASYVCHCLIIWLSLSLSTILPKLLQLKANKFYVWNIIWVFNLFLL